MNQTNIQQNHQIFYKLSTFILCLIVDNKHTEPFESYIPVEQLKINMLVKTYLHGFRRIVELEEICVFDTISDDNVFFTPSNTHIAYIIKLENDWNTYKQFRFYIK